jgi:hypothetical protein
MFAYKYEVRSFWEASAIEYRVFHMFYESFGMFFNMQILLNYIKHLFGKPSMEK